MQLCNVTQKHAQTLRKYVTVYSKYTCACNTKISAKFGLGKGAELPEEDMQKVSILRADTADNNRSSCFYFWIFLLQCTGSNLFTVYT